MGQEGYTVFTVSELSDILSEIMRSPELQGIFVTGEILHIKSSNGHIYMDLIDPDQKAGTIRTTLRAIIWRSTVPTLGCRFKEGDVVTCYGGLNYYGGSSSVSFIVRRMSVQLAGEGKALMAKRALLKKLDDLGLLNPERKRPLPRYVQRLAVVSSPEAAGYHDILDTLSRRFPCEEVRLFPATVQGASAPSSIASAPNEAYRWKPDAIIIGRGGGSKGDLSCFDDEKVAMAMAKSPCPIITAIGHQVDVSVADRLADVCAITPTDAANKINPSLEELSQEVGQFRESLARLLDHHLTDYMVEVMEMRRQLNQSLPQNRLEEMGQRLTVLRERLNAAKTKMFSDAEQRLVNYKNLLVLRLQSSLQNAEQRISSAQRTLESTSVEASLKRGFSLIVDEGGHPLKEADFTPGRKVSILNRNIKSEATIDAVAKRR